MDMPTTRRLLALVVGDEKHSDSSRSTMVPLISLYADVLRHDPADPGWDGRDRFILSKGHGCAAFYAVLAASGYFPESWLAGFMTRGNPLGSHPDRTLVPGVEASTGSLGHGLPMAIGVALALRARGGGQRVFCLTGDAELNEGSNWEAIMLAPVLELANLTLLAIDNGSSSIPMAPWEERLGTFGWDVEVVPGQDRESLTRALAATPNGRPRVVVADAREQAAA